MSDLKNIALTIETTAIATDLKRTLGIAEQMDIIKIGFAFAIRRDADLDRGGSFGTRGGSNYDTGGLDNDGLMAKAVELCYDSKSVAGEPYRAVETLMNKGLVLLSNEFAGGALGSLSDLATLLETNAQASEVETTTG